jgi:hypothetical protein
MPAEVRERDLVAAAHGVERLVHRREVGLVQALEPDQHSLASAPREQVQELLVVGGVDAGLAHPADLEGDEGAEELLGLGKVRGDVVVHEEEQPVAPKGRDLGHDLVRRPPRLGSAEDRLHRAEVAPEVAAAARLHQADRQIALPPEDPPVRPDAPQRRPALLAIELAGAAVPVVVEHLAPQRLRLPHDHGVGVPRDLLRAETRVESAHHHRHAAPAVFRGDLVRALRGVGLDGEGHEVRRLVERDLLHPVVVEAHLDVLGSEAGDEGGRQRLHLPGPDVRLAPAPADAGMHEGEPHAAAVFAVLGAFAPPTIQSQL